MDHLRRLGRRVGVCVASIRTVAERLLELAGEWWQWHWTRIAEEHGYADALTAE